MQMHRQMSYYIIITLLDTNHSSVPVDSFMLNDFDPSNEISAESH